MKFHRIYRSVLLNWGGGGGGAEYKENLGAQSLATSEKDSLENMVQATREPQMIKSKDSRPVSVSLDPAQSQNQPQMTLAISGYHVHSPSSRCWGTRHAHRASRQGGSQEQAWPVLCLISPSWDTTGPESTIGAGVLWAFPKVDTAGNKPGGTRKLLAFGESFVQTGTCSMAV